MPSAHVAGKADVRLWDDWHQMGWRIAPTGRFPVFVRATDDAALSWLQRAGYAAQLNDWLLAHMDYGTLTAAMGAGVGLQLRSTHALRPMSTFTLTEIDALPVQKGVGLAHAYTGHGVLVGLVDTGIDLAHPAFHQPDGSSRVVAVWDQDDTRGRPPPAFGYGSECDAQAIAQKACRVTDSVGHGTHVAGIAAGNAPANGVAWGADIAVVRSSDFTRLADAVAYLTQLATRRNQPLVTNISVGGQYGPHDGRTPLENYLESLMGPGRLMVAAAGNDGDAPIHIAANLSHVPTRVELRGLPIHQPTKTLVELWTAEGDAVHVTLELWIGESRAASVPLKVTDARLAHAALTYADLHLLNATYGVDLADHALAVHTLILDRSEANYLPVDGVLVLSMQGNGEVQGWISQTDYNAGQSSFGIAHGLGWVAGNGQRSIAVPATAHQILAVGSYTVQSSWESQHLGRQELLFATLGALSPFSSQGPTGYPEFTGFKPDLCAPGSVVVSARASGLPASTETVTDHLMVMQGTSMAAPHVTGTLALMLEANPTLGPNAARQALHESARSDEHTADTPNFSWGYGKLDAFGAIQRVEAQTNGCAATAPSAWGIVLLWGWLRRRRSTAKKIAVARVDC